MSPYLRPALPGAETCASTSAITGWVPACTAETHWHNAVTQVGEQRRTKLRVEALPERLHKALALVDDNFIGIRREALRMLRALIPWQRAAR